MRGMFELSVTAEQSKDSVRDLFTLVSVVTTGGGSSAISSFIVLIKLVFQEH